jgi:hypothetical protein
MVFTMQQSCKNYYHFFGSVISILGFFSRQQGRVPGIVFPAGIGELEKEVIVIRIPAPNISVLQGEYRLISISFPFCSREL